MCWCRGLNAGTVLIYDDRFLKYDFGPSHPLRPERLRLTHELIESMGLLRMPTVALERPVSATADQVLLFHTQEYVNLVRRLSASGNGLLDLGDTPAFKGCYEASLLYVGASLQAVDLVMKGKASRAFNPSGGLHHAHPERASGFCIFNDPAIAVAYLKDKYRLKRMMYLDVDAHHGDGVMYGYYRDGSLLNIDFHEDGRYLFPGSGFTYETGEDEGKGLKINVPLPPGTGDGAYLKAFREIVPTAVRAYRPEIMLMQCGADSHRQDLLARLGITTRCYDEMVFTMCSLAEETCHGRIILLGGGGYNISSVSRCWSIAFGRLAGAELPNQLPEQWRARFEEVTGERAPPALHDPQDTSTHTEMSDSQIDTILTNLRAGIPSLHRGGPART